MSRTIVVRYRVKKDFAEENARNIQAVFAELARTSPPGIRYASFRLGDGADESVGFMHVASVETDDGKNPLLALDAFQRFAAAVKERCVEGPVTTDLEKVGAYRFLDG